MFKAPVEVIRFALEVHGMLDADMAAGNAGPLSADMVPVILDEAARFAETELAPQNHVGDKMGARFDQGRVSLPTGWPAIYKAWAEAGWNGVDLPVAWGGMGLPTRLATAVMEIWTSANMAFALGPVLTQGAVDALEHHAADALKQAYGPKLVSGLWTATMNLTEPQAGSDLGLLRTRAERQPDGTYRITGNKIYITYGEHDLRDNIIHLVLARLPDAPPGTKGISLFLVPKVLSDGSRNDVLCTGIEHKLGIHASPTCSMSFGEKGGATGWIIGEENKGLACMFTMMNKARLYTGLQGVAVAERAYQQALAFARTRRQGRVAGLAEPAPHAIIHHPDVRRNLVQMRALTSAARALAYQAATAIDHSLRAADQPSRAEAAERAGLLTPIVKAWCSDIGCEVTSLGVQIHGGMGYVEETGAAQHFRDARITPIYEGTNGIQAIDLLTRKVLKPGSDLAERLTAQQLQLAQRAKGAGFEAIAQGVQSANEALVRATQRIRQAAHDQEQLLTVATPYLELFAIAIAASALGEAAVIASAKTTSGNDALHLSQAIVDATAFATGRALRAGALAAEIEAAYQPSVASFG